MGLVSKFNLNDGQTQILLKNESRPAGVYRQEMLIEGNSLLSSLFIESGDPGATVEVKYYDTTTGVYPTERFDLNSHPVFLGTSGPRTDRRLISRIHNKPVYEVTVVGGNVTFGLYGTVVSTTATDLDNALQLDGEIADLSLDKGMPIICYDEVQNKFFFLRGRNGIIPVAFGEDGIPVRLNVYDVTTPSVIQDLIVDTIPLGYIRKISNVRVSCRAHTEWELTYDDGSGPEILAGGFTCPMTPNDRIDFNPRAIIPSEAEIKLSFKAVSSSPAGLSVRALLLANDIEDV